MNKQETHRKLDISHQDDDVNIRRYIFRILPYWYIYVIALALCGLLGFLYLRYTIPIYKVSTRVIINDDSQERGNILENLNAGFRNIDKQTEQEIEVLQSRYLIDQVVNELKLNIQWKGEGRIRQQPLLGNVPLEVTLVLKDSSELKGDHTYLVTPNDSFSVKFNDKIVYLDKWNSFSFGDIKIKRINEFDEEINYSLVISSVKSTTENFKNRLHVDPVRQYSSIVDLYILDHISNRGELFLNSLLKIYSRNNVEFKNRIYENTLNFVNDRLAIVADELHTVEGDLQSFKKSQRVIDLGEQAKLYLEDIRGLDQRLGEFEIQLKTISEIEQYVQNRNKTGSKIPATLGLDDQVLISQMNQLFQLEFDLEKLLQLSGPKNPQIEVLTTQINVLKPSILESLKNLKRAININRTNIQNELRKANSSLVNIPTKEKALLDISRQQQIKNSIYTFLLEKREEASLAAAAQVTNLRIIDKPSSFGIVKPKPNEIYLLCFIVSVLAFSMIVYFLEFNNNKILFKEVLERKTGLSVIGELMQGDKSNGPVFVGSGKRSIIAEQIREIRTNLSYITKKGSSNIILFTSSIPGEGKTFLSLNLAYSLAHGGKKVILLEFDLRKPKLSKELNIKRQKGLSNFLISESELDSIVNTIDEENGLDFISCGPIPPNPAELIMNGRLEILIEELKKKYDYILLDAPPIGSVTDAKILASHCDVTLYLIRHNFTPYSYLEFIKDQRIENILPNPYLIFNGVNNKKMFGYSYGHGYSYGYGYGYANDSTKG